MNESTPSLKSSVLLDPVAWCAEHPQLAIGIAAFCLWVSVALIIRLWFVHRRERPLKKVMWSVVLLVPLLGWLVYGGCFTSLESINTPCPQEHNWGDTMD